MKKLKAKLVELEKRAATKIAELKDGMEDTAARAIEDNHAKILEEISGVRADIKDAEEAERAAADKVIDQRLDDAEANLTSAESTSKRAAEEAVANERKRTAEITSIGERFDCAVIAEEHVTSGSSVRDFKDVVLEAVAKRTLGDEGASNIGTRAHVGVENHEKRGAAMQAAILHRANPAAFKIENGAEEYRGLSLIEMARESLEVSGVRVRGMDRQDVAAQALARSGGYHGTSDFSIILGNVVKQTLRAAYEAAPQTFRPLVREVSVSDFKTVNRVQLGEAPQLDAVGENGEFKRGTIGEGGESYKIGTFGKIIGINRQTIINDDMNAFSRLPQAFGQQAAQLESDIVWAQILGNYNMSDGTAMFDASRKNLGTAAAFGVTPISKARTAMALQTGLDKKTVLNITPSYVIVPVGLQTTAEQVLRQTHNPVKASDNVATDSMRQLTIIAEPRLDVGIGRYDIGGNATAYYFAAAPNSIDTIELAYLEGNRGIYTEPRTGFDVDGIELKVRLDVGAKTIEPKAFHKNAGA